MIPALATQEDFEARLGSRVSGSDELRALSLLDDASDLVREVAGRSYLDDNGSLLAVPHTVMRVTVAAALRAFQNPGGFTSETLNGYTYQRRDDAATSSVYLTETEVADITRAVTAPVATHPGVGTLNLRSAFGAP